MNTNYVPFERKNYLGTTLHCIGVFPTLFIVLIVLLSSFSSMAQPYCSMACNDHVNISLGNTCESEITYDIIMEDGDNPITCLPNGPQAFVVTVMDNFNNPLPSSPLITANEIGQTLPVKVKHWATGNTCWATITVEDKLSPMIMCPPPTTVACSQSTDITVTGTPTVSDCSSFTVSNVETTTSFGCSNPTQSILRTFTATDIYGNVKSCMQTISVALPNINNVVFPPNRDGLQSPALSCENFDTDPQSTGFPTLNGAPIENGGLCNFGIAYTDQTIPVCEGTFKIIRSWTVADWCTSTVLNGTQVIKVEDDEGPVFACPANQTISTNSSVDCTASMILPSVAVTDNCTSTFSVSITTPVGIVNGNGGFIDGLVLGNYLIVYNATDDCGNTSSCTTQLTVVDNTTPTMICDEITTITLGGNGMADVPAVNFDDGSFDNCCFDGFSVRRMNAGCNVNTQFGTTVKLCCEDIGNPVQVLLRGTDCFGNTNECMVVVNVSDNINPALTCPASVTIECEDDINDPLIVGEPIFFDGCATGDLTSTDVENLNQCGTGTVTRTYSIADVFGNSATCTQVITIEDNTPIFISFPPDYTLNGCSDISLLQPDALPAPFDYPQAIGADCELIAYNFTDQVFTVAPPACLKVVRTWTAINWCTYNGNDPNPVGFFQGQQVLQIMDNEAPTIDCPNNFTVSIIEDDCLADVTIPVPTTDDCSDEITVLANGDLGIGYGLFTDVAAGTYTVNFTAEDGCGNSSFCSTNITVIDTKLPTPYCKDGLVVGIMNTQPPMVQVWANDFDDGSFDNCPGDVQLSFSPNLNDTAMTFTCDDLGTTDIELWVTDAAGNQDFCQTFIAIQDNQNSCGTNDDPLMAGGHIQTEWGDNVEMVTVEINDGISNPFMTGSNGTYNFNNLTEGSDYTVTPSKLMNPLNGITTFDLVVMKKHILGTYPIDSPYKMIAADANGNGEVTTLDMVVIKRLILHIDDDFQDVDSWRFVDASYEFPNPNNPWQEVFPETYSINNMAADMPDVDFIAIKVGDLTGNALINGLLASDDRGEEESLVIEIENKDFERGEEVHVDFLARDFKEILGYQFTLNFDTEVLDFVAVEPGVLPDLNEQNFGFRYLEDGKITTSWHSAQNENIDDSAVLFSLVFQSKMKMSLNKSIEMTNELTPAEAYKGDGDLISVEMQFPGEHGFSNTGVQFYGNQPNPFAQLTNIRLELPMAQEVVLTVFDRSGRTLISEKRYLPAGLQNWEISANQLPNSGVYFYTIQTGSEVFTGKMMKAE